jgi:glyoxylase-like metal-dependent hydrolase (beta-lactamase superfamily II)
MFRIQQLIIAAALAANSLVAAASGSYPMEALPVADDVYAVITPTRDLPNPENRGFNSNSGFVVLQTGVLLFDSGSSESIGASLRDVIAEVTPLPVRWIVNSHAHGDHWLGNAAFADTVEKIFATTEVARTIENEAQTWIDRFNDMTGGITGDSNVLVPNEFIDERTEIVLDDRTFVLFPSRDSHSPGDLIMWSPSDRVLFGGDVIYSDRMPSTFDSNLAHWIETLDELVALNPEAVIPGHGDVTDAAGVARLRDFLKTLWNAVEERYNEGLTDFEMTPLVIESLSGFSDAYPGLEEKIERDLSYVYLQVEEASF